MRSTAGDAGFVRRVLVVVAIGALVLVAWYLSHVLLVVFAAVLVAVLLHAAARPFERWLHMNHGWALAVATLALVAIISLIILLFGNQIRTQALSIVETVPGGWQVLLERTLSSDVVEELMQRTEGSAPSVGNMLSGIVSGASSVFDAFTIVVVMLAGGLYLAAQPAIYRNGVLMLLPDTRRAEAAATFDAIGEALRRWLVGQLVTMAFLFIITLAGLWLIGVPGALALAVFAGLAQFVPIIGPIVSAIPALLVALTEDWTMVLWVLGFYIAVQQIESNFFTPMVQRRAVTLPPALPLIAILVFGALLGLLGVIFATPLAVMTYVLVKKLWVRDALGHATRLPGEDAS